MFNLADKGKIEVFVSRLIGGGYEIEIDGEISTGLSKEAARQLVDESFDVAMNIGMGWKVYDADKLQ